MLDKLELLAAGAFTLGIIVAFAAFFDWIFFCLACQLKINSDYFERTLKILLDKCLFYLLMIQLLLTAIIVALKY